MKTSNEVISRSASLVELSLQGLASLYDEEQGLFAFYVRQGQRVPMPVSWSICYTAMALLGINKAQRNGWNGASTLIDERKALRSLVANWQRVKQIGHLGLIQWANAECLGQYAGDVTNAIGKRSSMDKLSGLPTMELAWLLTGFCATQAKLTSDNTIKDLAALYNRAILGNFNPQTGLFCHSKRDEGPLGLRSQIGNFADQIYAIFALCRYYELFSDKHSLQAALQCAECMCSLQGDQGQWWWHYHARRAIVTSRYPVYSVHQYGVGPMALQELAMVSGRDFQLHINRGVNWLFRINELDVDMVDWEHHIIWRDIEQTAPASMARYMTTFLAEAGFEKLIRLLDSAESLRVNHEMRPYELGWLLYALPGRLNHGTNN